MTSTSGSAGADLRGWAAGSYALEAAVELLIRAFDGRFATPGLPWVVQDAPGGAFWLDADQIGVDSGCYSGGERRLLGIVRALASDGMWLDFGTVLAGLDRDHLRLVLAAIAHTGGSHQQSRMVTDPATARPCTITRLPSLYPWPDIADDLDGDGDQAVDQ